MSKVVLLFLIFIAVLGILGKLRLPKLPKFGSRRKIDTAKKCPKCGSYQFQGVDCNCKSKTGTK